MDSEEAWDLFGLGVLHDDAVRAVGLTAHDCQGIEVAEVEVELVVARGMLDRDVALVRGDLHAEVGANSRKQPAMRCTVLASALPRSLTRL